MGRGIPLFVLHFQRPWPEGSNNLRGLSQSIFWPSKQIVVFNYRFNVTKSKVIFRKFFKILKYFVTKKLFLEITKI